MLLSVEYQRSSTSRGSCFGPAGNLRRSHQTADKNKPSTMASPVNVVDTARKPPVAEPRSRERALRSEGGASGKGAVEGDFVAVPEVARSFASGSLSLAAAGMNDSWAASDVTGASYAARRNRTGTPL